MSVVTLLQYVASVTTDVNLIGELFFGIGIGIVIVSYRVQCDRGFSRGL